MPGDYSINKENPDLRIILTRIQNYLYDIDARLDAGGGGGVTDHGFLTGLADDDHTQYHNNARGDARYVQLSNLNESVDDRVAALLVAGTNITLTYNDGAGTLTVDGGNTYFPSGW